MGSWDTDILANEWDKDLLVDYGLFGGNGSLENSYLNDKQRESNLKYPITIIMNENDYEQWEAIKKELK